MERALKCKWTGQVAVDEEIEYSADAKSNQERKMAPSVMDGRHRLMPK